LRVAGRKFEPWCLDLTLAIEVFGEKTTINATRFDLGSNLQKIVGNLATA
jgi:hypothetical protein